MSSIPAKLGRPPRRYRYPACQLCARQFVTPMRARPGATTGPGSLCDACWSREYRLRRRLAGTRIGSGATNTRRGDSEPLPRPVSDSSASSSEPWPQLPRFQSAGDLPGYSSELGQLRDRIEQQGAEITLLQHSVEHLIEELHAARLRPDVN